MTCAMLDERLDDWLDGTLAPDAAREVEAHLAGCPSCRERERELRQVLAHAAALPRSVTPPRDLWPGIERRIGRGRPFAWTRRGAWSLAPLAAAAAVVLAVLSVLVHERAPQPAHAVVIPSPGPAADSYAIRPASVAIDPGLAEMERDYQAASNALLSALQQRKDDLSPETLESVERNLAVIDEALAEVHRALEKDPASPELGRMLMSTHKKKVEVLRQVVMLSTAL